MSSPAVDRNAQGMASTNQNDILGVLAGDAGYNDFDGRHQAVVRASWDEQMVERGARLSLAAEFMQAGRSSFNERFHAHVERRRRGDLAGVLRRNDERCP